MDTSSRYSFPHLIFVLSVYVGHPFRFLQIVAFAICMCSYHTCLLIGMHISPHPSGRGTFRVFVASVSWSGSARTEGTWASSSLWLPSSLGRERCCAPPSSGSGMKLCPEYLSRLLSACDRLVEIFSAPLLLWKPASQTAGSGTPHRRLRDGNGEAHPENRALGIWPTTCVDLTYIQLVWRWIGAHPHASGRQPVTHIVTKVVSPVS